MKYLTFSDIIGLRNPPLPSSGGHGHDFKTAALETAQGSP